MRYLARTIPLDMGVLQHRYHNEMLWQMAVPPRENLTLELWIEAILEERAGAIEE